MLMKMGVLVMFCITAVLMCLLYVPSAHPPEWFLTELKAEHVANTDFWGSDRAAHILARMLDWTGTPDAPQREPEVAAPAGPMPWGQQTMMAEVQELTDRVVNNAYFRSMRSFFLLASYRVAALFEWNVLGIVFVAAALVDGLVRRVVKAKECRTHSAEAYGLHLMALVMMACAVLLAIVSPWALPPLFFASIPFLFGLSASYALANYHYRGG